MPHVRYPELAAVVREACADLDLPYLVHRSLWAALAAHYRWLRTLGARSTVAVPASA